MTLKRIFIQSILIFIISFIAFNIVRKFDERKKEPAIMSGEEKEEKNSPVNKATKNEPEVSKSDIEERIRVYLEEGNVKKAKRLFEEYQDIGLKASLLEEIKGLEMDLVIAATEKAKDVYFESYAIEEPKQILKECQQQVGTDNKILNKHLELYESCNETKITSLNTIERGNAAPRVKNNVSDAFGKEYIEVLSMNSSSTDFTSYGVYYIQDLGIDNFAGTITPSEYLHVSRKEYRIEIATMDENQNQTTVYQSPAITKTTLPFDFSVDIGDAPFLLIKWTNGDVVLGPSGGAYIVDGKLFKRLEKDDFDF